MALGLEQIPIQVVGPSIFATVRGIFGRRGRGRQRAEDLVRSGEFERLAQRDPERARRARQRAISEPRGEPGRRPTRAGIEGIPEPTPLPPDPGAPPTPPPRPPDEPDIGLQPPSGEIIDIERIRGTQPIVLFGPAAASDVPRVPIFASAAGAAAAEVVKSAAKSILERLAKTEALRKTVERILAGTRRPGKQRTPPRGGRDDLPPGREGRIQRQRVLEEVGRAINKGRGQRGRVGPPRPVPTPTEVGPFPEITEVQVGAQRRTEGPDQRPVATKPSPFPFLLTAGVLGTVILAQRRGATRAFAPIPGALPRTETPPAPTETPPSPIIETGLQTQTQVVQQFVQRTRTKECVEVKRKRKRGRCFEGFYEERRGKTIFTDWREVDCDTGRTIPKRKKVS